MRSVDHELEPVVVLGIAGGLRPSETYGLGWADIDFTARTVRIAKGLHQRRGDVWYEDAKSRASNRTIVLPEWAIEAMRSHRGIGRVCGELTPNQVAWRYQKHVMACELSPWCPIENLRHTYAAIAAERGVPADDLAPQMGHTSAKMINERYAKRRVMRSEAAAQTMEGVRRLPSEKNRNAK